MKITSAVMALVILSLSVASAWAMVRIDTVNGLTVDVDNVDACTKVSYLDDGRGTYYDTKTENNCTNAPIEILWTELNLTLGPIQQGEVQTGENWVFVDTDVRPDLDKPAKVTFNNPGFVVQPFVYRNGARCDDLGQCNVTHFDEKALEIEVPGFSNYSLTGRQDFTIYTDPEPELKDKTYQTIDLGDANRGAQFNCIVQVFGKSTKNSTQWVLVQTNPKRDIQARMFGSPDPNQPESLGYFKVENGIANTYFRGDTLYGYNDMELVIQCANTTQKLVYEEAISTRYSPAGRALVSRGMWLTDGSNANYVVAYIVGGLILLWVLLLAIRRTFRRY